MSSSYWLCMEVTDILGKGNRAPNVLAGVRERFFLTCYSISSILQLVIFSKVELQSSWNAILKSSQRHWQICTLAKTTPQAHFRDAIPSGLLRRNSNYWKTVPLIERYSSSAQRILFPLSNARRHDEKEKVIDLMCFSDITPLFFSTDAIIFMSLLPNPIEMYVS